MLSSEQERTRRKLAMLFQTLGFLVGISIPWGQVWSLPVWSQTIHLQPCRTVFLTSVPSGFLDNLSTGRPEGEKRGETRVYLSEHLSSCYVLLALVPVDDLPLHGLASPGQSLLCIPLDLGNISPLFISHVANSTINVMLLRYLDWVLFSWLDFEFNWKDASALELDTVMNQGNSADDPFGLHLP